MSLQQNTPQQDDEELLALGYVPSFRRGVSNFSTISFAFGNIGVCSSIASTFNTPLTLGGPTSVTRCWFLGIINTRVSEQHFRGRQRISNLWRAVWSICSLVSTKISCRGPLLLSLIIENGYLMIYRWAGSWAGSTSLVRLLV